MWIGCNKNKAINNVCEITFVQEPVKLLGIYVGYEKEICNTRNWNEKGSSLELIFKTWENKNVSFFGKITIIKTLALSKLIYRPTASVTDIPASTIPEVKAISYNFWWKGKKENIKRNTIAQDITKGGLKGKVHPFSIVY